MSALALGIDLGTSGIRSAVLDADGTVLSTARGPYGAQKTDRIDANAWWDGVTGCLGKQVAALRVAGFDPRAITRIAVDGTSGTMVLTNAALTPVTEALMNNSRWFTEGAAQIAAEAPDTHITRGTAPGARRICCIRRISLRPSWSGRARGPIATMRSKRGMIRRGGPGPIGSRP